MGWLSNIAKNPIKAAVGFNPLGSVLNGTAGPGAFGGPLGAINAANGTQNGGQGSYLDATSSANLTPAQQQQAREADITRGQARGQEIFVNDPVMKQILAQRQERAKGINSAEYQGMRDDMIRGQQGANTGYMRQLLSRQGAGGVGGARAAAQQGELVNQFATNRADAERKLLLDNIALKDQGMDSLQNYLLQTKYGTLASGLGEAQLGVADRTGYLQGQIGQQMAAAAAQQPKQGLLGSVFGGIL